MEEDRPQPVRFRVVLELTFPEADPWDPTHYDKFLEKMTNALSHAPDVKCTDVVIREAESVGPADDYEKWRGQVRHDFAAFSPHTGYVFGASYPVAVVDPADLANVWAVLCKAESGELQNVNLAVAIGQALPPGSDVPATIARAYFLKSLQTRKIVAAGASRELFEKAATMPIEAPPEDESVLNTLARYLR
jgi:hypothetical protein